MHAQVVTRLRVAWVVTLLGLVALLSPGNAQPSPDALEKTYRLQFSGPAERLLWVTLPVDAGLAPSGVTINGDAYEGVFRGEPADRLILVLDKATGNLAERRLAEVITAKVWQLNPENYNRVGTVRVRVQHEGDPVANAQVQVESSGVTREALLGQENEGVISLHNLPHGEARVTVRYSFEGTTKSAPVQIFEINAVRDNPEPELVVSISDPVPTVAPAPEATEETATADETPGEGASTADAQKEEAPPAPNPLGSVLATLLTLVLVGGLIYAIFVYVKKNPQQVKGTLENLGVNVPEPNPDPGANPPAVPVKPDPPKPILIPGAEIGAAVTPAATTAVGLAQPRLLREDGTAFSLPEGATLVSREAGPGLALVGEGSISRRHAELTRTGDAVVVADLGSTNGTFVNGAKLTGPTPLRPGDQVQFGAVRFRFEI